MKHMCNPIYHVIYLYSVRHNQYQNTRDFWRMIHMKEHVDNIVGNVFQDILSTTYEKIKHEIS